MPAGRPRKRRIIVNIFGRPTPVVVDDDEDPPSGAREPRRPPGDGGDEDCENDALAVELEPERPEGTT